MKDPQHKITLARRIGKPAERVYEAWTDADRMRLWAGDRVEADTRIGGSYRFDNADGDTVYVHTGEFLVLEPGRRVRMSFRAGPEDSATDKRYSDEFIEVNLQPLPDGATELLFVNGWNGDPLDEKGIEAVRQAWSEWLDRLETALAAEPEQETKQ